MDNVRLFLWVGLIGMLWISYSAWITDHAPPEPAPAPENVATDEAPPGPGAETHPPQTVPTESVPPVGGSDAAPVAAAAAEHTAPAEPIHVRTDVLDLVIDAHGGDLVRADLLEYPVHKDHPNVLVRLLDYEPETRWIYQTGLSNAEEGPEANHQAHFTSDSSSYELAADEDELVVKLSWDQPGPLHVDKIYTFRRGRYDIGLDIQIDNRGNTAWSGAAYSRMVRRHTSHKRTFRDIETYSFWGPVLYDGEQSEKLDIEKIATDPLMTTAEDGWYAGIEHHFLAAGVPPPDEETAYTASAGPPVGGGQNYVLTAVSPVKEVAPGDVYRYPLTLFVGPKLQDQLRETADKLALTVDYGKLRLLAQPLFWVLEKVHTFVGNWGWSIIIMTMLIKLAFYKLTATSGRSMAKLRKLGPRIKAMQERYKDDRQALSQAMMELYKKEKVNPAAGCLPILIQMPFFFSFYWVLIESVEMRQAPFMLWIQDISAQDPYYVLPLLMGAAMFFQTRLNPAPPDPMQARVMQIMPIAFTAFFAFFPAGLVLYWLTNTLTSILQQWRINTLVARENN